jgi:hypothetical protein
MSDKESLRVKAPGGNLADWVPTTTGSLDCGYICGALNISIQNCLPHVCRVELFPSVFYPNWPSLWILSIVLRLLGFM